MARRGKNDSGLLSFGGSVMIKLDCSRSQTWLGGVIGGRTRSWVNFSMSLRLRSSMRLIGGGDITESYLLIVRTREGDTDLNN